MLKSRSFFIYRPTFVLVGGQWAIVLTFLTAFLGVWIVGNFSGPLSDGGDTDHFEYAGYFFAKNISLWPWPHLSLNHNQVFYPYGLNQVFLDWGFERDYWYALCYRLRGGPGGYLQVYYIYTLLVASVGTFLLLQARFGIFRSFMAGLIVSIFNVYAVFKFPVHMNICVGHWTTLCLVATYRLLYDLNNRQRVPLPYWLLLAWLHIQVLGQELGYVAGYALTFTTLAVPVIILLLYRQHPNVRLWLGQFQQFIREEWQENRRIILLMVSLLLLSTWLYLPLTFQIATTALTFDFREVPIAPLWSHPIRLLLPHLPDIDALTVPHHYQHWLHDNYESFGQGSPGLYLTLLAGVGVWQTRSRVALWLPIVVMLVLCLLYHPVLLPTLRVFPWFSFNRHGGRSSLVYPVLLMLLALSVRWPKGRPQQVSVVLLGLLLICEWTHLIRLRTYIPTLVASPDLLRYCAVIKQQPGVAVLDFPFCIIGGDGTGESEGLCPYYEAQNAVFSYRRFYNKKVVGQYFGRLHPDQIAPFLRDGWPRLLAPGHVFTEADWQFLDQFLRKNNFAGINLYPDLLTPAQRAGFQARYGPAIAQTRFPAAGRVVFLPLRK